MDVASGHTEEAYTAVWLAACFAQMRAERDRFGWDEATAAWAAAARYAAALGNELDARVFRGLAKDAAVKAIVEGEMNKAGTGTSDDHG